MGISNKRLKESQVIVRAYRIQKVRLQSLSMFRHFRSDHMMLFFEELHTWQHSIKFYINAQKSNFRFEKPILR